VTQSPRFVSAWVAFAVLSVAFCAVPNETARWWIGLFTGVALVLGIRTADFEPKDATVMWASTLFPGLTLVLGSIGMLRRPYPESAGVVILAGALIVACFIASMILSAIWLFHRRQRARSGKAA
jgi:hypothetical protein